MMVEQLPWYGTACGICGRQYLHADGCEAARAWVWARAAAHEQILALVHSKVHRTAAEIRAAQAQYGATSLEAQRAARRNFTARSAMHGFTNHPAVQALGRLMFPETDASARRMYAADRRGRERARRARSRR